MTAGRQTLLVVVSRPLIVLLVEGQNSDTFQHARECGCIARPVEETQTFMQEVNCCVQLPLKRVTLPNS